MKSMDQQNLYRQSYKIGASTGKRKKRSACFSALSLSSTLLNVNDNFFFI